MKRMHRSLTSLRLKVILISLFCCFSFFEDSKLHAQQPSKLDNLILNEEGVGEKEDMRYAASKIEEYHRKEKDNKRKLIVTYFHPSDKKPEKDYKERIHRIMTDVRGFYRSELKRNGFANRSFKLQMGRDNKVLIHVVKGKKTLAECNADNTKSGYNKDVTEYMNTKKIKNVYETQTSITFHGWCDKKNGKHDFLTPYYGGGTNCQGGCCVTDCEFLDTKQLENTSQRLPVTHGGKDLNMNVALFNVAFIGGVAHELGHAFSLPHNGQRMEEGKVHGEAMMGVGNWHYRGFGKYQYRGSNPGTKKAFMTPATCLRLAAHPLITGSDRGRNLTPTMALRELSFEQQGKSLVLKGVVSGTPPIYGVIAYENAPPKPGSYYRNTYIDQPWIAAVKDNKFRVKVSQIPSGKRQLQVDFLFVNGASLPFVFDYEVDDNMKIDIAQLNKTAVEHMVKNAFITKDSKRFWTNLKRLEGINWEAYKSTVISSEQLVVWKGLMKQWDQMALPTSIPRKISKIYLSDTQWSHASAHKLPPSFNTILNSDLKTVQPFYLNGAIRKKGLFAPAPSNYIYRLGKKWKSFSARICLQQGWAGSVTFIVKGDGKVLYESKIISEKNSPVVKVKVRGVNVLELITNDAGDGSARDLGIWVDPKLKR